MDDNKMGAGDFNFAFNNPKFSDRVLSIEIIPDPLDNQPCDTLSIKQQNGEVTSTHGGQVAHSISYSVPDEEDSMVCKKQDGDGIEATRSSDFSAICRVKTIHINSAILAIKSPYFYKLFSNGMRESERVAMLRIYASEETALMELLNFMYKNSLSTTTVSSLLDILKAADKYDVASCVQYCSQRLSNLPMNCDLALTYLDLPSSALQAVGLQQLTNSAKQFIAVQFRDVKKFEKQVLNLSLAGIEAILSSDDIQVRSEDVVYDLVLKWAEFHYPQLEERREVLETHLRHLIRFPYMTSLKLKEVTAGTYFSPEVASEIVLDALFFKSEPPYRQRQLALGRAVAGENLVDTYQRFVERAYMCRPVKAVELELPRPHCVVHLTLKREECVRLFPDGWYCSEPFYLGEHCLYLTAHCNMEDGSQCFGLFLGMRGNGSASLAFDYEFAVWEEDGYSTECNGSETLSEGETVGIVNLFDTNWDDFMDENGPFFIDGILHLRVLVYHQVMNV